MKRNSTLFNKFILHTLLALTLFFSYSLIFVNAEGKYPKPTDLKYINDYTSTLDINTKEYIVSVGKELEYKTGAQEVVVLIDSLQGSDIETYANELFRTWGIGQKGKDNGLLILISMQDREWRVEVGTSLEGAITDIYSARVMDTVTSPRFKEGKYAEGIKAAYSIFADTIAKEYNVTLDRNESVNLPEENNIKLNNTSGIIMGIPMIVLIVLDFIFNRGRITMFFLRMAFWFGGGSGGKNGKNNGGGFGGFGGGSSSGGGSSGKW